MQTTILLAEDHAVVREPMARLLRCEGYRTLCAGNGIEALAVLEAEPVDMVLLDLMMPKQTGVGFMESLRRNPRWRDLPVILMTGVLEGSHLERVRELGVTAEMPKAKFAVEELLMRIRECVEVKKNGAVGSAG